MSIAAIEHIVIVIMENRSFDHMLGYLSLEEGVDRVPVDGLQRDQDWLAKRANRYGGKTFPIHRLDPTEQMISDPRHDEVSISMQINTPPVGPGLTQMGGFVQSYMSSAESTPHDPSAVMGYYDREALPVFDFFARNYCICDHWFSSVPLGTQANRLMAMGGESRLIDNSPTGLPFQKLVYDWLHENGVTWRAYQFGTFLPIFCLMARWATQILVSLSHEDGGGHFKRYRKLREDWNNNHAPMPSVIFIEPQYTDGINGPGDILNDDHAPTGVAPGQAFLADIYETLTGNPERWAKTMLLITYDEHGGFYDHVPPLQIETTIQGKKFGTTGVRVPAFIISPYARRGVLSGPLEHSSIPQLLDDWLNSRSGKPGAGPGYSVEVNRRQVGLERVMNALLDTPRDTSGLKCPTSAQLAAASKPVEIPTMPDTPNGRALYNAVRILADQHPDLISKPTWANVRTRLNATGVVPKDQ